MKQETVSGSGISWATCKSAPRSRQITTPVPHHSVFYRPDALPAAQPTVSKHRRYIILHNNISILLKGRIQFLKLVLLLHSCNDRTWFCLFFEANQTNRDDAKIARSKTAWQAVLPNCLDFAGAVNVTFLVLISNSVQVILKTFQQWYQELLCILLTTHKHTQHKQAHHTAYHDIRQYIYTTLSS